MNSDQQVAAQRTFLGHPVGLFVLFFTEMWERFSFYGMKALLIFYLVKYHLFSDESGNLLLGSYAALVYALPVVGGYLADRFLGFRKAVIFGAIMLVLGHIGMAYEGNAATILPDGSVQRDETALQILYISLSFIILGVGFLKANISSIVGELYDKGDGRKDSAFTIFYMGINLGSFFATIICVWLGESYGWSYGFGAAGVGMLAGLFTFIGGKRFLNGKGEPPHPEKLKAPTKIGLSREVLIYVLSILSIFLIWQTVQHHKVVEIVLVASLLIAIAVIVYIMTTIPKIERHRLAALSILILFSVVFWALFEQAYSSLNLFAERVLDREVFGWNIPAGSFLSLNAFFIFIMAPVFAWLWVFLSKRNRNPNGALKFGLAITLVGLGFGALVFGIKSSGDGLVAAGWLVLAYFLHTIGELILSPVGLSYVTKLTPGKFVGFMMGVWFLATAFSEYIAVLLANFASMDEASGTAADLGIAKEAYIGLFEFLFYAGLAVGAFLLLVSPLIKRLMHGIEDRQDENLQEAAPNDHSELIDN